MKILIVDDSRFQQNFLVKIFQIFLPEGELLKADNGIKAFDIYKEERPDFVLTDLLMPERSGQDLLRLIKEFDQQSKVIVITADIQKSTRDELNQMGALAFFNKPLNNENIAQLIELIKEAAHA